jgi:hypothetical protein
LCAAGGGNSEEHAGGAAFSALAATVPFFVLSITAFFAASFSAFFSASFSAFAFFEGGGATSLPELVPEGVGGSVLATTAEAPPEGFNGPVLATTAEAPSGNSCTGPGAPDHPNTSTDSALAVNNPTFALVLSLVDRMAQNGSGLSSELVPVI